MAQSGFAFFFLAVLMGCSFALARWVQLHWQRIRLAVRGETAGKARLVRYRAEQRRPIDLPYVAMRMLGEPSPVRMTSRPPSWGRRRRAFAHQLRLGF